MESLDKDAEIQKLRDQNKVLADRLSAAQREVFEGVIALRKTEEKLCAALTKACAQGDEALVKMIAPFMSSSKTWKAKGALDALYAAALNGHLTCLKIMVNLDHAQEALATNSRSPLMGAIEGNQKECFEFLLPMSSPSAKTSDGKTLLMIAAAHAGAYIRDKVSPLCELEARDDSGMTSFLHACAGSLDNVLALQSLNANRYAESKQGWNALHIAAEHGKAEIIEHLLKEGVDAKAKGQFGATPLMKAAMGGHSEAVKKLLPASDPLACDKSQLWTALQFAVAAESEECVRALSSPEACAIRDMRGSTPLLRAASGKSQGCIKALLEHSDVLEKSRDGEDVATIARNAGNEDMGRFLRGVLVAKAESKDLAEFLEKVEMDDERGERSGSL